MQRRTAPHPIVAVSILLIHGIRRVVGVDVVVNLDAVAQVAHASLDEDAAVGIGPNREQFARLQLEMHTALIEGESGVKPRRARHLAVLSGDAFAENINAVAFQLVAENEVAIGCKYPIRGGLEDETAADGIAHAIVRFQI